MINITLIGLFSGSVWQILSQTSAFGLFILAVLAFMSLGSWMVIFQKWHQYKAVEKDNDKFRHQFRRTRGLAESLGQAKSTNHSTLSNIYLAGYEEISNLKELKNEGGALQSAVKPLDNGDFDIVEMTMEKTLSEEMSNLRKRVIFLASTASSAPFMGLLGTVVGIMDSFWSIGQRGSASLAVVAPGIAEALLATIVGLAAAIPAVIAYNWANSKMRFISEFSNNFILEFLARAKKEVR